MPETVYLFCVFQGDPYDRFFPVEMALNNTVGDLKKAIRAEKPSFKGIDADSLQLWKANLSAVDLTQEVLDSHELDYKPLDPYYLISEIWPEKPSIRIISVILKRPPRTLITPSSSDNAIFPSEKTWYLDGAMNISEPTRYYYIDPAMQPTNTKLLARVTSNKFVLLSGARASGKTTRMRRTMEQLQSSYLCAYVSFESLDHEQDVEEFWKTFGRSLQASFGNTRIGRISSASDFLEAFLASNWTDRKIVLFLDELSTLFDAPEMIRNQMLRAIRELKNNRFLYAIHSIVACGTFSILRLSSARVEISPFNVAELIQNPYFSQVQTRQLFSEFETQSKILIDARIVDDIWRQSRGHPGMVCLCGRFISEKRWLLVDDTPDGKLRMSFEKWQRFSAMHLLGASHLYITFRSMTQSLLQPRNESAVKLLRSHFAGSLDTVIIGVGDEDLADSLVSEGVLARPDVGVRAYAIASPLVDGLIRSFVIPQRFPCNPPFRLPLLPAVKKLLVKETLIESLKCIDKDLIQRAHFLAYKQARVQVDGVRPARVPRESVYDTELMRILTNWLSHGGHSFTVTGQWHLHTDQASRYCDIVISKPGFQTVVLEILASGDPPFIQGHIEKMLCYKDLLSANEAWVVHFTREDNYFDHATWPSEFQVHGGINMMQISHDESFSVVTMSACWLDDDGHIQWIDREVLSLTP